MFIVDCRFRAPYKDFANSWLYDAPRQRAFAAMFGSDYPESGEKRSMEMAISEMEAAGISVGVTPGRKGPGAYVDNAVLEEIHDDYPGKFVTLAGIDATEGIEKCFADIDKYVINGRCKGIAMETGAMKEMETVGRLNVDDRIFWNIYEKCQANDIPIAFTHSATAYGDMTGTMPHRLQNIFSDFPKLKIILMHGGWPWHRQIVGFGWKQPGLYIVPDMYMFHTAGWRDFVDAGNYMMKDKMMFGSAYPLTCTDYAVDYYINKAGFHEDVLPKIMGLNAAKLFGIDVPQE